MTTEEAKKDRRTDNTISKRPNKKPPPPPVAPTDYNPTNRPKRPPLPTKLNKSTQTDKGLLLAIPITDRMKVGLTEKNKMITKMNADMSVIANRIGLKAEFTPLYESDTLTIGSLSRQACTIRAIKAYILKHS